MTLFKFQRTRVNYFIKASSPQKENDVAWELARSQPN
jgi:hypothetical protein